MRPVIIMDEFERLLEADVKERFPFPGFYNGLRSLITADRLAMVVASRLALAEYFRDPNRPGGLTSTFPSYFTPFTLRPLDNAAADALLLQPSDHRLTVSEAAAAKRWAKGHPCHLQVAGQAYYEAKARGRPSRWIEDRYEELKDQSCMANQSMPVRARPRSGWLKRILGGIFVGLPIWVGRLTKYLGARFDDLSNWLLGVFIIIVIFLALIGAVGGSDLWEVIKKGLGLE